MFQEEFFLYGDNGSGFGITTLPACGDSTVLSDAPIVVLLNAGLLHRSEPYRLNTLAARRIAGLGYISIRIDLAGKGDSKSRDRCTNRESVAIDWTNIKRAIESKFGPRVIIIMGLCSGADNAIKLSVKDQDIRGMILLDPISIHDKNFEKRKILQKLSKLNTWLTIPSKLFNKIRPQKTNLELPLMLRDIPTVEELIGSMRAMVERKGRALAIFTGFAATEYNAEGQLAWALKIPQLDQHCEEVFWPGATHLYSVQFYRDRLINKIETWCSENKKYFMMKE